MGVKGSLNEYELDVLRQRAWEARREKAMRGELVVAVPVGFIKTDLGTIEMDPDRRVQEAAYLVFHKFQQLGSVRQTLFWFLENELELPARHSDGNRWTTVWQRPRYANCCVLRKVPTTTIRFRPGSPSISLHTNSSARTAAATVRIS